MWTWFRGLLGNTQSAADKGPSVAEIAADFYNRLDIQKHLEAKAKIREDLKRNDGKS